MVNNSVKLFLNKTTYELLSVYVALDFLENSVCIKTIKQWFDFVCKTELGSKPR